MLLAPTVAKVWNGIDCYAMDSNALATYPFHWIGMQTIGMDTYGFVAGVVVDAAPNVLTQQDRMLTVVQSVWGPMLSPSWAGKRRSNRPLAPVLRTSVRRAIIAVIAHLLPAQIAQ